MSEWKWFISGVAIFYDSDEWTRAGIPNPREWTGAGPWPVADRVSHQEMSCNHGLHRAIADHHSSPAMQLCPCVLSWLLHLPVRPIMSSNLQGRGQEELQIEMDSSSRSPAQLILWHCQPGRGHMDCYSLCPAGRSPKQVRHRFMLERNGGEGTDCMGHCDVKGAVI